MAKAAARSERFEERLSRVLREKLRIAGIGARVETEPVEGTKLHRVYVTSPTFAKLRPTERQDLVWRIVGSEFPADDQFRISMILTLSSKELEG